MCIIEIIYLTKNIVGIMTYYYRTCCRSELSLDLICVPVTLYPGTSLTREQCAETRKRNSKAGQWIGYNTTHSNISKYHDAILIESGIILNTGNRRYCNTISETTTISSTSHYFQQNMPLINQLLAKMDNY